ncbi:hypothetical protein VTH82DRAFT_6350 [Thermothelomyces myriococcoides]
MAATIKITIPYKLGWKKLNGYNNTGNTATTIHRSVEITQSIEISTTNFTHTVTERAREQATKVNAEISAKATYSVVEASVSSGVEHSTVMKDLLSHTKEVTRKQDYRQSTVTKESFDIGPGDQLYFYQRVFNGPGISCSLDVTEVSSDPSLEGTWTDIDMALLTRPVRFIKYMDVEYTDGEAGAPDDHIREVSGKSADINQGMKGKYVWLKPVWTFDSDEAATGFEIRIQDWHMEGWKDLAKGAGGSYRYVYSNHNSYATQRVVDARLIRGSQGLTADTQVGMLHGLGKGW